MREQPTLYRISRYISLYIILVLSLIGCGSGGSGQNLQAPVARAGEDTTLQAGDTLILDGVASYDADGQIISYQWEENGTILGKKRKITLNTLQAGSHTITLTVKDNDGLTGTDTLSVQIWPWDVISFCTYTYGCEPWRLAGNGKGLQMLKDINPTTQDANPMGFTVMGGYAYFFAHDSEGVGLWKMDQGENPVPKKIKKFSSAFLGNKMEVAPLNGSFYFSFIDYNTMKSSLWKSDGTAVGTTRVYAFDDYHLPSQLTPVGNQLFFVMHDTHAGSEVWVSDGSYAGTHRSSIVQDDQKGDPKELTAYQGWLYFVGNDGATGDELWRTNGTPVGTTQVADINPGAGNGHVSHLTVSGGKLYFSADDGHTGQELWIYDGNSATLLKDIMPNTKGSYPEELTDVSGKLYFVASDNSHGRELWESDGTPSGTMLYYDIRPGPTNSYPHALTPIDHAIGYIATKGGYGPNIYKGKSSVTLYVSYDSDQFYLRDLISNGSAFGFVSGNTDIGWEPYGMFTGSYSRFTDIAEGPASSNPQWLGFGTVGDHLYFSADDKIHGRELWMSDGTEVGTYMIDDITSSGTSSTYKIGAKVGDIYYFVAQDNTRYQKLYRSDGTDSGTYALKRMWDFQWMIPYKGKLFFACDDRIYSSNGTVSGTQLYQPSTQFQMIRYTKPAIFHNKLYFTAYTLAHNTQIYHIDGTNSLERVSNFTVSNSKISDLTVMGDKLYFSANDGTTHGTELWKSDGTMGGISIVKDIVSGGGSSMPEKLTLFKNKLYFTATLPMTGRELWVSDGSSSGTKLLTDINTQVGASSNPKELTVSGEHLYFTTYGIQRGRELWRTDGTAAHTLPVMDIYPGTKSSSPANLFAWEGHLLFDADDGTNGRRIWMLASDTQAPWMMDSPLDAKNPFVYTSWRPLTVLNHKLFYQLIQGDGTELWVTDGTEDGTEMLWKEQW